MRNNPDYKIAQIAKKRGVSKTTVYGWIKKELKSKPAHDGRGIVVDSDDLKAFLEKLKKPDRSKSCQKVCKKAVAQEQASMKEITNYYGGQIEHLKRQMGRNPPRPFLLRNPEILTKAAMELLGKSRSQIYKYIHNGAFPSAYINKIGQWVLDSGEINAFTETLCKNEKRRCKVKETPGKGAGKSPYSAKAETLRQAGKYVFTPFKIMEKKPSTSEKAVDESVLIDALEKAYREIISTRPSSSFDMVDFSTLYDKVKTKFSSFTPQQFKDILLKLRDNGEVELEAVNDRTRITRPELAIETEGAFKMQLYFVSWRPSKKIEDQTARQARLENWTGSEKQIAWAKAIKENIKKEINTFWKRKEEWTDLSEQEMIDRNKIKQSSMKNLESCFDAKFIIDSKDGNGSEMIYLFISEAEIKRLIEIFPINLNKIKSFSNRNAFRKMSKIYFPKGIFQQK